LRGGKIAFRQACTLKQSLLQIGGAKISAKGKTLGELVNEEMREVLLPVPRSPSTTIKLERLSPSH
jgi:hypothetical protein